MLGKKNKTWYEDCFCSLRQERDKRSQRILKKINKAKEKRVWIHERTHV